MVDLFSCRSGKENFGYTAPSSELVIAWFLFEDVAQHLLCSIMLNGLLE